MKRLSKADILNRAKVPTMDVEVPEWKNKNERSAPVVTIARWGIRDASNIAQLLLSELNGVLTGTNTPQIVACSIVDEDGNLMFGSEEGVEELCALAGRGLKRVKNAALHFNELGWLADDEEGERLRAERAAEQLKQGQEEPEDPKN